MTQKNSHKNTKDAIQIYTDGSCLKNPYGPGGYAAIIRYQSDGKQYEMRLSGGAAGTTNNRMELMAVIEAVKHGFTVYRGCIWKRMDQKLGQTQLGSRKRGRTGQKCRLVERIIDRDWKAED